MPSVSLEPEYFLEIISFFLLPLLLKAHEIPILICNISLSMSSCKYGEVGSGRIFYPKPWSELVLFMPNSRNTAILSNLSPICYGSI